MVAILLILCLSCIAAVVAFIAGTIVGTTHAFKNTIDYLIDNPKEAEQMIAKAADNAGLKVGYREKEDRLEIVLIKKEAAEAMEANIEKN